MPLGFFTPDCEFNGLLEASPDAMIIVGAAGRIVLTNSLADSMFGYAARELVGEAMSVLMPIRFREQHEAHQARFFANPSKRPMGAGMELLGLRKNGEEFPAEISLASIDAAKGRLAISAVRDITQRRKEAEELARMNQELIAAQLLVKQLSGYLPICGFCKNIRDEHGEWHAVEVYIRTHSEATFTHGVCPDCGQLHYGAFLNPGSHPPGKTA